MQKIVPNLWFNGNAVEAVDYYTGIFDKSAVLKTQNYPNEGLAGFQKHMAGEPLVIEFELAGYHFTAINADDTFKPNSSVSFMLNFDPAQDDAAEEHLRELWNKLADGGEVLMELTEYPYSKLYGWVRDRYGYSWQLILTNPNGEPRPFLMPSLLFGATDQNKAKAAVDYYVSIFEDAKLGTRVNYDEQHGPADAGAVMFSDFQLAGQWFTAMDAAAPQDLSFTEATSFVINCQDQTEIDYFWDKLSTNSENEQCGWCKDQFGVSWQVMPHNINELVNNPDGYAKMMEMKKIIIDDFKA